VRNALLAHFNASMLRVGEQNSMLASRFALVYLFHRYALAAAVNVVGSAKVPLSLAGDGQQPITIWPPDSQKEALKQLFSALEPAELEVRAELWSALAPNENRDGDSERFTSSAGYVFSPLDGARAVAEIVVGGLLDVSRVERLAVMCQQDPKAPSPSAVISALVNTAFSNSAKTSAQRDLQGTVQTEVAERLMILAANPEAPSEVRAAALAGVREVQDAVEKSPLGTLDLSRIDHEIKLFLENPQQNTPKIKDSGAPVGPPV